jgi:hypothetical protein
MKLHLEHSKTRFSLRSGAGETRASIIRVRQRGQYGRSMGIRDEDMVLTFDQAGALPNSLSPNTAEDGSVIDKFYSPHIRESIQIKTVTKEFDSPRYSGRVCHARGHVRPNHRP